MALMVTHVNASETRVRVSTKDPALPSGIASDRSSCTIDKEGARVLVQFLSTKYMFSVLPPMLVDAQVVDG